MRMLMFIKGKFSRLFFVDVVSGLNFTVDSGRSPPGDDDDAAS